MASIRQRRSGVWEVRAFTGYDERGGGPKSAAPSTHQERRHAPRCPAAQLTVEPSRKGGGKKVAELLDDWIETKAPTWAPLTQRDHQSRAVHINDDPIARSSVASLSVSDIDRWVSPMRKDRGRGECHQQTATQRPAVQQWQLLPPMLYDGTEPGLGPGARHEAKNGG